MRSISNCRGQSIVEITLITPLLLVALYVPFDFGVAFFVAHLTQNAVREGARVASTTPSLNNTAVGNVADNVYANLPNGLVSGSPAAKDVTVTYYATGAVDCVQVVEVKARGTYNFFWYRLIGLIGLTPPAPIEITRTTKMRYEWQPDRNGGTLGTTDVCATSTATATRP
jgi:Flp pilus assembly protein TadG